MVIILKKPSQEDSVTVNIDQDEPVVIKAPPPTPPAPPSFYLNHLRVRKQSLTYRGAMLSIPRYRLRASSCPDIYRNSMTTIAGKLLYVLQFAILKRLLDLN